MPLPTVNQGHVDQLLTNISVAYIQSADKFVADKVFPMVPVEHQSDLYLIYPRGYFFRDQVGPRPIGGYSNVAGYALDKASYLAEEQGLSAMLDDRERANATPPYDPERSKTIFLTQQHLIHRDRTWAAKYFQPGVWTNELTGVAASPGANQFVQWDQASADPVAVVDGQRDRIAETTGFEPNVIVAGRKVFRALKNHPAILDRIKYTQRGIVTTDLLAELFGVEKFLVPGGVQNTAAEGQPDQFSFIVDNHHMLLAYAAPNPGLDQPSAGYIFSWRGLFQVPGAQGAPGGNNGYEAVVWRGRDERAHSDWFEVRMAYDQKVVAADLAVFFANAVA